MAAHLGMIREEMMDAMSASEFREWMILEQIEPFGDRRLDLIGGIIASTIANCHRGKDQQPFKASDFMPKFDEPPKQTSEQQFGIMKMLMAAQASRMKGKPS